MENITFLDNEIHALYSSAGEEGKALLEKKYGKDFFSDKGWTELFDKFCKDNNNLIITQDSHKARNEPGYTYLPHAQPVGPEEEHDNASRMIRTIIAYNNKKKEFKTDYKNKKQYRYFPVFEMKETGLVFSNTSYEGWNSGSFAFVGAPFVSPTHEDAMAIAKEYLPIYIKYLQVNQ